MIFPIRLIQLLLGFQLCQSRKLNRAVVVIVYNLLEIHVGCVFVGLHNPVKRLFVHNSDITIGDALAAFLVDVGTSKTGFCFLKLLEALLGELESGLESVCASCAFLSGKGDVLLERLDQRSIVGFYKSVVFSAIGGLQVNQSGKNFFSVHDDSSLFTY